MKHIPVYTKYSGQALTSLLIIVFAGMAIAGAASTLVSHNTMSSSSLEISASALTAAESGIENALLRLLRNPMYPGETLTVNGSTATITVTNGNPIIITSKGASGAFARTIQVEVTFNNGIMTILSWKEI